MIVTFLRALRVYQWSKNLLVFAALVFAQQLTVPGQVFRSVVAFFSFCFISSTMYLLNDLMDIESDRIHPEKRMRPLASGAMKPSTAIALMMVCLTAGLAASWWLSPRFLLAVIVYIVLTGLYSVALKRALIVDILAVAIGFVIRAMAGAVALDVAFSNWLVVCTLFLALLFSISKRRHEIQRLNHRALEHREVLGHYSVGYLDMLNHLVAGATLITYTIYTCSHEVVERLGTDKLYMTLPFVVYGLFRYLYLVQHDIEGGDPSSTLLRDRPLGITVLLWGLACVGIIYAKGLF